MTHRFRVCFTAPSKAGTHFYWLYARDLDDAKAQGRAYAQIHSFETWEMTVWRPSVQT